MSLDVELVAQPPPPDPAPPVAGAAAWWDAADESTIQAAPDGRVQTWRDKIGGRLQTAASASQRPYTGSRSQNGRNVIWAPIGTPCLTNGPNPGFVGQPYTAFTVAAVITGDAVQRSAWSGSSPSSEWGRNYRTTADQVAVWSGGGFTSATTWQRERPRVVTTVWNGASSSIGVDARSSTAGGTIAATLSTTVLSIFSYYNATENWQGWVGELLVYGRLLSAGEIGRTEAYLMRKWGTA